MVKHYYDDRGVLNYQVSDRSMLVRLSEVIGIERLYDEAQRPKILYEIVNATCGIIISYGAVMALGGMGGGCKTPEEYLSSTPNDPLEAALLPMFRDMLENGVLHQYFTMVAMAAFFDCVMATYSFGEDMDD
jgi:hypothetical protein